MNKQEKSVTISPADIGAKSTEDFLEAVNRHALIYGAEIVCTDGKCTMSKQDSETFLWLKGKGEISDVPHRTSAIEMRVQMEMDLTIAENDSMGRLSRRAFECFAQKDFRPYS